MKEKAAKNNQGEGSESPRPALARKWYWDGSPTSSIPHRLPEEVEVHPSGFAIYPVDQPAGMREAILYPDPGRLFDTQVEALRHAVDVQQERVGRELAEAERLSRYLKRASEQKGS